MEKDRPYEKESQNNTTSIQSPDFFAFLKANGKRSRSSSFFSENGLSQDIIQVTDAEPDICLEVFYALYNVLWPQIEKISDTPFKDTWKVFIGDSEVKGILCPPEKLIRASALQVKKSLSQLGEENQIFQELNQVVDSISRLKRKAVDFPGELLQREEILESLYLVEGFYKAYLNKVKSLVREIINKEQMSVPYLAGLHALEDLLEPKAIMMSDSFPNHWAYRISRNKVKKLLPLSNLQVTALPEAGEASEPLVFFKANQVTPIQPEKEFMLESLYRHLQIPVPETALLILTNVFEANPGHFYAVQASEAVNGMSGSQAYKNPEAVFDEEAYVLQVIGSLLTNPSHSSFHNFQYCPMYKTLISIGNDLVFEPELHEWNNEKVVNVKSVLYLLPQIDLSIPESIKTLMTTLDPDLTILSWLNNLNEKNKGYKLLFTKLAFQETRYIYQNLLPESQVLPLETCLEKKVLVDSDLYNGRFYPQILVSESLLSNISEKLQLIEQTLLNHRSVSAQTLFEEVSPILGKYYRKLRFEFTDPEEALHAVHGYMKNSIDYSKISSLLDHEDFDNLLDKKIVQDENLLPEMFFNSYKSKLISGETPPLDKFIRYQSQRKMMNLLNPRQILKELQFLIKEGFTDSQSPRDIIDFCYGANKMKKIDPHFRTEITSLLHNLPNPELKWLFTVEKYFLRANFQIPADLRASSIPVTGAFMKQRILNLTEYERVYLFDEQGNIKKNPSLYGRSSVTYFPEKNPEFYLKEYPQFPGYELASMLFMRMIGIAHLPHQDLIIIDSKYPALLSQKVDGDPVFKVDQNPGVFNYLDPFHTGLLIICAMLLNPEDGKPDNFILSQDGRFLIPIDNDQCFLPSSGSFFNASTMNTSLHTKTLLFCLDEMDMQIPLEVRQQISSLDFDKLLALWLAELIKLDEIFNNLIDQDQYNHFLNRDTVMRIPFYKEFIQNIHWKAHKIQDILKIADGPTPFDLLKAVEPFAARYYQDSFKQGTSFQTRLRAASSNLWTTMIDGIRVSILDTRGMMEIMNISEDDLQRMGPLDSLERLNQLIKEHNQRTKIEKDLLSELDDQNQENLLEALSDNGLSETALKDFFRNQKEGLILNGSKLVKSSIFKRLFATAPDKGRKIRFLSLPDSPFLTDKEIRILVEECPNIEYLNVSRCQKLTEIVIGQREWPLFARLEAKECLNLEKFVSFSPIKILRIETDCQIDVFIEKTSLDIFMISKKTKQFELKLAKGENFVIKSRNQAISTDCFFLNLLRDEHETRNYFRDIKITMGKNSISSGKDLMIFIKDINLRNSNIKVDDVRIINLLKLINLKSLDLSRNGLKGIGYLNLLVLGNWPKLNYLNLSGNEIHDVGLEILTQGNWPELEVLNLQETKITALGVETFVTKARWEKLKDLYLSENKISDRALVVLCHCQINWPLLETLQLKNTDITKRALFTFLLNSYFANLRVVDIGFSGNNLVDGLLRKDWSQLEELDLSDCGITQNEVEVFVNRSPWSNLKHLNLSHNDLNDECLEILCQGDCPKLEILDLKRTKITIAGVEIIVNKSKWAKIKQLNLSYNKIDDEGLQILAQGDWSLLETLNLESTGGTKKGFLNLISNSKWANLQEINFGWNGENIARNLAPKNWHLLEELDLSDSKITQKEVELIVEKCHWPHLKHLNLSSNYEINYEGLAVLCRGNWPMLETLNLENTSVTKKAALNFLLHSNWFNFKTLLLPKWWNDSDVKLASSFIQKDLSQVERLDLNNVETHFTKIEAILSRNKCQKLKYLSLSDNEISQEGKERLLGITECHLLEELSLRNIQLTSNEIDTILNKSNWHRLKHLDVSNNQIFDEGLLQIILADWPFLETLNLSQTNLSLQGVEAILDLSKWQQLKHLDVSQNELLDEGLSILSLVNWPLLESLNLSRINCSSKGVEAFVEKSKWPQLKNLNISDNEIFDEGISALTLAEWELLEELNLKNTKITQKGLEVLVNQMKLQKLKKLNISQNVIYDDGLKILASAEWLLFEHLVYYETQVTRKGHIALLENMRWPNLHHLEHSLSESFYNCDESQDQWSPSETIQAAVPMHYKKQFLMVVILNVTWLNSKEVFLEINHQDLNEKVLILPQNKLDQLESINLSFSALPRIKALRSIVLPTNLKTLDLSNNSLADDSKLENFVCTNYYLLELEVLQLKKTNITTKGLEILLRKIDWQNLKRLDLSQNVIQNEGLEILASVSLKILESLDLEKTDITDGGIEIIISKSNWPNLKKLNISRNKIQDKGLEMLCCGKWPLLESLTLQSLDLTAKGIESITSKSEWPKLKVLDLSLNRNILDEESESLASGKWPLLEYLYLNSTNIELKVVEILVKKASWPNLKEISLLDNIEINDHQDVIKGIVFRKWPNVKLGI